MCAVCHGGGRSAAWPCVSENEKAFADMTRSHLIWSQSWMEVCQMKGEGRVGMAQRPGGGELGVTGQWGEI